MHGNINQVILYLYIYKYSEAYKTMKRGTFKCYTCKQDGLSNFVHWKD